MKYILIIVTLALLPAALSQQAWLTALLGTAIFAAALIRNRFSKNTLKKGTITDGAAALVTLFLTWQLLSDNFGLVDTMLFPPPERVFRLFVTELPDMAKGLLSSLYLLGSGYLLAIASAVPLGLAVGYSRRLRESSAPFVKVLGAIPPIVYIPYAIALLPSFSAASIFVIYIGAFWPIFVNTVSGVELISPGILDSARMLHLNKQRMFYHVILPGAMPSICTGTSLGLVFSFLLLTAAELIGATEGLGWYVKNFSDFADYERVIVGIIFIGIVITAVTFATGKIERKLLYYREVQV